MKQTIYTSLIAGTALATLPAAAAPTLSGDVSANLVRPTEGTGTVFYSQSNNLPPAPTASGFGDVSNSLGQTDANSYGGSTSGSQTYGGAVSWGGASAASSVGDAFTFTVGGGVNGSAWGGATADASLDLDLTGAPVGSSVQGLADGAVGGTSFDGSDTGGVNGNYTFNVEFTIDALVAGDVVDGAFGIQVDVFNFTTGDLVPIFTPRVSGTGIVGTVDMTEETRIDALGDAWMFSLSAADIEANGGSINGTYTAEFSFVVPNDPPTGNSIILTIDAFALGEAQVVPEPGSLALLGLGGLLIATRRRRS